MRAAHGTTAAPGSAPATARGSKLFKRRGKHQNQKQANAALPRRPQKWACDTERAHHDVHDPTRPTPCGAPCARGWTRKARQAWASTRAYVTRSRIREVLHGRPEGRRQERPPRRKGPPRRPRRRARRARGPPHDRRDGPPSRARAAGAKVGATMEGSEPTSPKVGAGMDGSAHSFQGYGRKVSAAGGDPAFCWSL